MSYKVLIISTCLLISCSDSIKTYKKLDEAYKEDELYTSLQKALKNKDEVKILKMHDHKIEQIPPEIGQLQKLECKYPLS